jgi:hypothetical protein
VLAAYNLTDEAKLDQYWYAAEVAAELPSGTDARVWLKGRQGAGREYWISTDPGEFRTTPPPPPCVVHELPEGSPRVRCRHILEELAAAGEAFPPIVEHEQRLLDVANQILAGTEQANGRAIRESLRAARDCPQEKYQEVLNSLCERAIFDFESKIDEFSYSILLLQLQRVLAVDIQEDWTDRSGAVFAEFMRMMLAEPKSRDRCVSQCVLIMKAEYENGRATISEALNGQTMSSMPRKLLVAFHRFQMARALEHFLRQQGVPPAQIGMNSIVIEESQVCTMSGLTQGAHFFIYHPDLVARDLLFRGNNSLPALRRAARASASEILPMFTRFFADMLAAQALTLSDVDAQVESGTVELNRLKAQVPLLNGAFERGWINRALLKAYKAVGDEAAVQRIAFAMAGEITAVAALGREYRAEMQGSPKPRQDES